MRIRTQFTAMVVGIALIPLLLLAVGWVMATANQNQGAICILEAPYTENATIASAAKTSPSICTRVSRSRSINTASTTVIMG